MLVEKAQGRGKCCGKGACSARVKARVSETAVVLGELPEQKKRWGVGIDILIVFSSHRLKHKLILSVNVISPPIRPPSLSDFTIISQGQTCQDPPLLPDDRHALAVLPPRHKRATSAIPASKNMRAMSSMPETTLRLVAMRWCSSVRTRMCWP